jgi:hypothetical protein
MKELETYKEFLQNNKIELKWTYRNSLKARINHTLSYILKHLDNSEINNFINDYINDLERQMKPLGKLPKENDTNTLKETISLLKRDYIQGEKHNELFLTDTYEEFFKHCVNYLLEKGKLDKTSFVHFYFLFNLHFLRSQERGYCKYVDDNYIKSGIIKRKPFKNKVTTITSLHSNLNSLERRNNYFIKAQEEWNNIHKKKMNFDGVWIK